MTSWGGPEWYNGGKGARVLGLGETEISLASLRLQCGVEQVRDGLVSSEARGLGLGLDGIGRPSLGFPEAL